MASKVYVTHEVTIANYGPAERYGDVVFLSASEISNVANSLHNRKLIAMIRERLREYNADTDYVAPSGSPIITGIVFAILHERFDTINVLKWNARDGQYTEIRLDLKGESNVY